MIAVFGLVRGLELRLEQGSAQRVASRFVSMGAKKKEKSSGAPSGGGGGGGGRRTANAEVRQKSPAEFFAENKAIAGFDNAGKALYTTVRELVENGLDSAEAANALPDISVHMSVIGVVVSVGFTSAVFVQVLLLFFDRLGLDRLLLVLGDSVE